MIENLKRIVKVVNITLDHSLDKNGELIYKWEVSIQGEKILPIRSFDTFTDCVRDLIQAVEGRINIENIKTPS